MAFQIYRNDDKVLVFCLFFSTCAYKIHLVLRLALCWSQYEFYCGVYCIYYHVFIEITKKKNINIIIYYIIVWLAVYLYQHLSKKKYKYIYI